VRIWAILNLIGAGLYGVILVHNMVQAAFLNPAGILFLVARYGDVEYAAGAGSYLKLLGPGYVRFLSTNTKKRHSSAANSSRSARRWAADPVHSAGWGDWGDEGCLKANNAVLQKEFHLSCQEVYEMFARWRLAIWVRRGNIRRYG